MALPIIVYACCDYKMSHTATLSTPELYKFGMKGNGLKAVVLLKWMLNALLHSVIPYFLGLKMYSSFLNNNSDGLYVIGLIMYTVLFLIANLKVFMKN